MLCVNCNCFQLTSSTDKSFSTMKVSWATRKCDGHAKITFAKPISEAELSALKSRSTPFTVTRAKDKDKGLHIVKFIFFTRCLTFHSFS